MKLRNNLLALSITLMGLAASAQANLIVNGSFQDPDVGTSYVLRDTINGWSKVGTNRIEVGFFGLYGGISGTDGDQVCELDSTGNARIKQSVATTPGCRYELKFLSAKRGGTADASNRITVYYNGTSDVINPTWTAMREETYTFVATSVSTDIEFEGGGTSDSLGSIIDNVRLIEINQPPVAVADAYSVVQATSLIVSAAQGVLSNDSDGDLDPIEAVLVDGTTNGSLTLNADGSFSYTPTNVFFTGTDSFTYRAYDGCDYSDLTTVTIEVTAPGAAGFITGGGRLAGVKRTFGLVAKVVNGSAQGNLEYQDHEAGLNVKSSSVTWVYTPSSTLGYFRGTCTVNGVAGYTFFVEVNDGPDALTIWVFDSNNDLYYTSGSALAGGNIKIH